MVLRSSLLGYYGARFEGSSGECRVKLPRVTSRAVRDGDEGHHAHNTKMYCHRWRCDNSLHACLSCYYMAELAALNIDALAKALL